MTLIICANIKCIHSKKRDDGLSQCGCTAIGVNQSNECDSYMVLPKLSECETEDVLEYKTAELLDADPDCDHVIRDKWSGIECTKCGGWFCY